MATVEEPREKASSGTLLATSGPYTERMFTVGSRGGLIGRSRKCRISLLHDCEVSHNHAVIEVNSNGLCIRDVGSTFGTYLNDKRLSEPKRASDAHKLKPCDSIKVGQTSLRWRPIEMIRTAVAVAVPRPFGLPALHIQQLAQSTHASTEVRKELLEVLMADYKEHTEAVTSFRRAFTPIDLPQLYRRMQLLLHVQAQAVAHACHLRDTIGAQATASLAADASPPSSLAADHNSDCERLCELIREVASLRSECLQLHAEQRDRLAELISVHRHYSDSLVATPLRALLLPQSHSPQ